MNLFIVQILEKMYTKRKVKIMAKRFFKKKTNSSKCCKDVGVKEHP
jgi:hypothetical protein